MRWLAVLLALAPASVAQAQPATAEPSVATSEASEKLTLAREIVGVMFPVGQREETMRSMVNSMIGQMRQAMPPVGQDPGVKAIMDRYFDTSVERLTPVMNAHMPAIFEATAVAYTNRFSLEELRATRQFAASPAGARFLSESSTVIGDPAVAAANQAYFAALGTLQEQLNAELTQALTRYFEANPSAIPSSSRN